MFDGNSASNTWNPVAIDTEYFLKAELHFPEMTWRQAHKVTGIMRENSGRTMDWTVIWQYGKAIAARIIKSNQADSNDL